MNEEKESRVGGELGKMRGGKVVEIMENEERESGNEWSRIIENE